MMKSRKVLLLLFIVQLIFALTLGVAATAPASEEDVEFFTAEVSTSVAKDGDTVTVTVSIPENPGFAIAAAKLSYDPTLVTYIKEATALSTAFGDLEVQDGAEGPGVISISIGTFDDFLAIFEGKAESCTATGTVAVLTFKVAPSAELKANDAVASFVLDATKNIIKADGSYYENVAASAFDVNYVSSTHIHTIVIQPEVAPTCTETGLTSGTYCSFCGVILTPQETIPAIGHDYGACVSNNDNTHTQICKNDATHVETVACAGGEAVCGEKLVCDGCNTAYGEPVAHVLGAAATCTTPQICTVCEAEVVAALGHTPGEAATCVTAQICTVCNGEVVAALGHTPNAPAATCTVAQTCTVCNEILATKEHTPEVIPAVEATYSSEGATEGKKCSECGVILEEPTVIEAKSAAWIVITVIASVVVVAAAVAIIIVLKKRK